MSSNRIVVWTLAAFLLSFIAYWMLLLWSPEFHAHWLQGEDRAVEWLTFAGFLSAAATGGLILRRYRRLPGGGRLHRRRLAFLLCLRRRGNKLGPAHPGIPHSGTCKRGERAAGVQPA